MVHINGNKLLLLIMMLKVPYRYYPSLLTRDECDTIIKREEINVKKSTTSDKIIKDYVRNSENCFLEFSDKNYWIYNIINSAVKDANFVAGWKWDIQRIEEMQFTKYSLNQYYYWHADGGSDHYGANDPNLYINGLVRKISVTINLVDGEEYEGGDLFFSDPEYLKKDFGIMGEKPTYKVDKLRNKGAAVIFPSFTYHKVSPVTKGTRYSLVAWALGKPWR